MLLYIFFVIIGTTLIVVGANFLTDGASAIAAKFNISDLIIGLTVVAFGTSAPELTISVISSLGGSPGISVGNVIGSNIVNILGILGITALIFPLPVSKASQKFDLPIAILCAILLILVLVDLTPDKHFESMITRSEGLILLCFGALFIYYSIYMARKGSSRNLEHKSEIKELPIWRAIIYVIGGLLALIYGGKLFVDGSSSIAKHFGVSDTIIGLTLVAWGTSLPELATSLVAAFKKKTDMAIGNVIGSNIFNILFVLGVSATIKPLTNLTFTTLDLTLQIAVVILTLIIARFITKGYLNRWGGLLFVIILVAYNWYLIANV